MPARLYVSALVLGVALAALGVACGGSTGTGSSSDASADSGHEAMGQDGGTDAQSVSCDGSTCKPGQVCVVTTSSGGACQLPDDAGMCPNGKPGTPGQCCNNTSVGYACQTLPPSCNGKLACPCAESLCQCGGCQISGPNTLSCTCAYP